MSDRIVVEDIGQGAVVEDDASGGRIVLAGENTAAAAGSATLSQAWAEGTLPGGAGTKSAKEWADDADARGGAQVTLAEGFADDAESFAATALAVAAGQRNPNLIPDPEFDALANGAASPWSLRGWLITTKWGRKWTRTGGNATAGTIDLPINFAASDFPDGKISASVVIDDKAATAAGALRFRLYARDEAGNFLTGTNLFPVSDSGDRNIFDRNVPTGAITVPTLLEICRDIPWPAGAASIRITVREASAVPMSFSNVTLRNGADPSFVPARAPLGRVGALETSVTALSASNANKPDRLFTLPIIATDGGTANAQTVATPPPGMTSYFAGQTFLWLPNATNTAADPTLNIGGLGARIVRTATGTGIVAGDIVNGRVYLMRMSGATEVRMLGIVPSEVAAQATPAINAAVTAGTAPLATRLTAVETNSPGAVDDLTVRAPNLFTLGEVDASIAGSAFRNRPNGSLIEAITVNDVGAWRLPIPVASEAGAWLGRIPRADFGTAERIAASVRILSLSAYSGAVAEQRARVMLIQFSNAEGTSEISGTRVETLITTDGSAITSPVTVNFNGVTLHSSCVMVDIYIGVRNTSGAAARTIEFDRLMMARGTVSAYRRPPAAAAGGTTGTAFRSMTVLPGLPISPDPALVPSAPNPRQDGGAPSGGFTCTGIDRITRGIYQGCWAVSSDGRVRESDGSVSWPRIVILSADFRQLVTYFDLPGVGDGIQGIAVDTSGATDTVWVASPGPRQLRQYELYGANAGLEVTGNRITFASGFLPGNGRPNGLAYIASEDRFWVGVTDSATVSRVSKAGAIINQVTVGTAVPDQLHYDDPRNLLYASAGTNGLEGTVWMHRVSGGANTQPFGTALPRATAIEGIFVDRVAGELIVMSDGGFHWPSNPWPINVGLTYGVSLPV